MKILENVLIANLTTMRLGGATRYAIEVENMEDVPRAYKFARERNLPIFVLGAGANTIGHDEGFPGVIILNRIKGLFIDGDIIRGMGGELWDDVVKLACENNLSGIEAMSAIPGTLGAAPVQNIGAYGQEISQVITEVEAYDSYEDKIVTISKVGMGLKYRQSIFNTGENVGRYFIVAVTMQLNANQHLTPPFYNSLQKYIEENHIEDFSPSNIREIVMKIRADKLPDPREIASSGSFFKNVFVDDAEADKAEAAGIPVWRKPGENKINAGWLIDNAGLKGAEFNGMRVNPKASLVLINDHAKSYADLAVAREKIRDMVKRKFGYELEQEPVEIVVK